MTENMRLYGIIGDGIDYSVSPAIYNAVFIRDRVDAVYNLYNVTSRNLRKFVETARLVAIAGFNITTPHKQNIIPLLDRLDKSAHDTCSVNLVLHRGARLLGYNTDLDGIKHSIENGLEIDVAGESIVMFGSGGSAHTVYHYLVRNKARKITVVYRSAKGRKRFERFVAKTGSEARYQSMVSDAKPIHPPEHILCVNCTPSPIQRLVTSKSLRSLHSIFELRYGDYPLLNRRHLRGNLMLAVQAAQNLKLMEGLDVSYQDCLKTINRAIKHD